MGRRPPSRDDATRDRRFVGALAGMVAIYLAVVMAASATTAPLIGHVPTSSVP